MVVENEFGYHRLALWLGQPLYKEGQPRNEKYEHGNLPILRNIIAEVSIDTCFGSCSMSYISLHNIYQGDSLDDQGETERRHTLPAHSSTLLERACDCGCGRRCSPRSCRPGRCCWGWNHVRWPTERLVFVVEVTCITFSTCRPASMTFRNC